MPLIDRIRRNLNDAEETKSFVDQIFHFCGGIDSDRQKLIKKCMVEVLLTVANSPSESVLVTLWRARKCLESVLVVREPCSRAETPERAELEGDSSKPWQIILPSLDGMPENWLKFTLAHELAHGMLKDLELPSKEFPEAVKYLTETRANALVESWGLAPPVKEVKKKAKE